MMAQPLEGRHNRHMNKKKMLEKKSYFLAAIAGVLLYWGAPKFTEPKEPYSNCGALDTGALDTERLLQGLARQ